jgi:ribosomal protein S27AE
MGFTTAENLGGDKETVALLARRRIIKKCAVCGAMAQDKNLKRCGKCHSVLLLQGTPGKRLRERAQATIQYKQLRKQQKKDEQQKKEGKEVTEQLKVAEKS